MDPVSKLRVDSNVKNLSKIRNFIQKSASGMDATQEIIDDVILAVNEAATNIIIHGYKSQTGIIDIELWRESDAINARLTDQAPRFDPTKVPSPDLTLPLENRPVGKVGIHLIRHMVEEMIYEKPARGGNRLTLVKKFK